MWPRLLPSTAAQSSVASHCHASAENTAVSNERPNPLVQPISKCQFSFQLIMLMPEQSIRSKSLVQCPQCTSVRGGYASGSSCLGHEHRGSFSTSSICETCCSLALGYALVLLDARRIRDRMPLAEQQTRGLPFLLTS